MKNIRLSSVFKNFFVFAFFALSISLFAEDNVLKQTSKAFVSIGKNATPAVVFIQSEASQNKGLSTENENMFEHYHEDFFKHFFGMPQGTPKNAPPQVSSGSGFIINKDGYIVTNYHIIKNANKITVSMNDSDEFDAKIVGSDPKTDLAVIKINAKNKNLPYLKFADSNTLEMGEWAIAIGSPFTLRSTLTVGVISATSRQGLNINDYEDFIQTDASLNPGNSGGPLLNIDGEVIGVNSVIYSQSGGYMGIGFAISSNMTKHVINQIINNGSVERGYLGIYQQVVDKEIAEALNLEKAEGILISDVIKNTPASKAGLKQGDVIIGYNGITITSISQFRNDVSVMKPGSTVTLKVIRNGKTKKIPVKLGSQKEDKQLSATSNQAADLGVDVEELKNMPGNTLSKYGYTKDTEGLIITKVRQNSLAFKAGLKPGMLIQQINQTKVKTIEDFHDALKNMKNKKHLLLLVKNRNTTRFITIRTN
jgi:serine protease Do